MKKIILAISLALPLVAQAQAPSKMQAVTGGVLVQVAVQRGFAANDPRMYSTLYAVGKATAATAATVATGALVAGTAPAWGSILLAAAASAAVGYAVNVAIDGTVKWIFTPGDFPITQTVPGQGQTSSSLDYGAYFVPASGTANCYSMTMSAVFGTCVPEGQRDPFWDVTNNRASNASMCVVPGTPAPCNSVRQYGEVTVENINKALFANGYHDQNGVVGGSTSSTPVTSSNLNFSQAVAAIPPSSLSQPADNAAIALILNQMWQQAAAQPGYSGIPYSMSSPITAADVATWQASNPNAYPTVGDLVAPVANPSTGFAPSSSSDSSPVVNPTPTGSTNAAASQPQVNLGVDPNIGAPNLEAAPSANQIISPISTAVAPFKSFVVPSHLSECPKPTFTLFEHSYLVDAHCTLFEQNRQTLYAGMLLVWTLIALFIILSA